MGLNKGDLRSLVYDIFEIDSFKSKMGDDRNIMVLAFTVDGMAPAKDLERFAETGYKEVYPHKIPKKLDTAEALKQVLQNEAPHEKKKGDEKEIMKAWRAWYTKKGLNKYAAFKNMAGLNAPYALFKSKNIVDVEVRAKKWFKARPISPSTKHPMKRLMTKTGKAWNFVVHNIPLERFKLVQVHEVPKFIEQGVIKMSSKGPLDIKTYDIEGCFPNMPKEAIKKEIAPWAVYYQTDSIS